MKVSDLLSMLDNKKLTEVNYGDNFVEFIQNKSKINSITVDMTGMETHTVLLNRLSEADYFRVMDANFDPLNKNIATIRVRKWYTNVTLVISLIFAVTSLTMCFAYAYQDEMLTPEFRESLKQTLMVVVSVVKSYFE